MPDPQVPGPDPTAPGGGQPPADDEPAGEDQRPGDDPQRGDDSRPGEPPATVRDVEYKGAPLDAAKGPGLGCFWIQVAALVVLVVLTPLSASWGWPDVVTAGLLLLTIVLLLFAGQTMIFLLRLVAADRRAELRRAPLASRTKTVGQLEDETSGPAPSAAPVEPRDGSGGVPE